MYKRQASGSLSGGGLDQIDTIATVALVKYRTTAPESVNAQFAWHNGAAHGFKSFPYTGDGEWHFAITDLTTDTDAGSGPWTDALMINWFRFDFANNYTAEDPAYSVDLAYIAMFESEEDAQAYAEEDGGATFPGADDNDDQQGGEDEGKDEPKMCIRDSVSVTLDFGEEKAFSHIALAPRTEVSDANGGSPNYPTEFTVSVSDDGRNFTEVVTIEDSENPMGVTQGYELGPQRAAYVRIDFTGTGTFLSLIHI